MTSPPLIPDDQPDDWLTNLIRVVTIALPIVALLVALLGGFVGR